MREVKGSKAYFPNKAYTAIPFRSQYFTPVQTKSEEVIFIDGGNAEIVSTPALSLQFIRTAAVKFSGKEKKWVKRKDFYSTTATVVEEEAITYVTKITAAGKDIEEISLNALDKTVAEGGRRALPSKMGSIARRIMELITAREIAQSEKGVIIAIDGTLEVAITGEEKYLEELFSASTKNNNIIVALAKTSSILTDKGDLFAELLEENAPEGSWQYSPVVEISSEKHKADMRFAKLHSKSKHIFRIEIYKRQGNEANRVMSALAATTNDLAFPGYPYGFVLADRLARVSNNEAEHLKAKAIVTADEKLMRQINALNAHELLDNM
jgi:hypothetical protein